jgi:hypothetical protein
MTEQWSPQQWQDYQRKQDAARNSKYGAIPMITADGRNFDSTVEGMYYNRCLVLLKSGEIVNIEHHVRFEFIVNGIFIGTYELDFRVTYADGRVEHVDTKSKPTLTGFYRFKKQLMKACHGIDLIEKYEEDLHQGARTDRRKKKEKK